MMKLLLAYDGSDCSERAVEDLKAASLPEHADAVVFTVAENWIDPAVFAGYLSYPYLAQSGTEVEALPLEQAQNVARRGAEKLSRLFPRWKVQSEAVPGAAADGIIKKINIWKPDLVVMGSHGRSSAGRLVFGSVSHKILTHVHCNLRISKNTPSAAPHLPARVLVAYDGSQESETAFNAVLGRCWPRGTAIRVLTVKDLRVSTAVLQPSGPIRYWIDKEDKEVTAWVDRMLVYQKKRIEEKGFAAYADSLSGDPKRVILREAESWGATEIFVGCRGLTAADRIIAGSVSTSLAMHAHCPVEVIHRAWDAELCCDEAGDAHRECMTKKGQTAENGGKRHENVRAAC